MSDLTTDGYYWLAFLPDPEKNLLPSVETMDSEGATFWRKAAPERITKRCYPDLLSAILAEPAVFGYDVGSMLELVAAGTAEMDCR